MELSICICTYNRADILQECLQALLEQKSDLSIVEILVVDNNSKDHTVEVCSGFQNKFPNFKYILENTQGLSYARNTAYQKAASEWICYLDDDALASEYYSDKVIEITKTGKYKAFGGPYHPWYKYGKPKWFRDEYGTYTWPYEDASVLKKNQHLVGANMIFHKELLVKHGGFNPELGMRGNTIGYGEENELQVKILEDGLPIYWAPEIAVLHLVPKFKLDLDWYFKSAFSLGRDSVLLKSRSTSVWNVLLIALTSIAMLIVHLIIYTPRLLSKNYHIENWLIDVFKKIAKRVGIMYTALTKKT